MKPKPLTLITGAVLGIIFLFMLFAFQVRETQVAVVTTFGKFARSIDEPGLKFRWPYPIQKIYKFDNRIRAFERKFDQTSTEDGRNLLITVYTGWRVSDARTFLERFDNGDIARAEQSLENLVRDAKNGVISKRPFRDLISPNPEDLKFEDIEREMLAIIQPLARTNYGIEVGLLGIKQLGLPESITTKVFDRMKEERQRLVKQFRGEGDAQAIQIRSEAQRERQEILAQAEAKATIIRGQAEGAAARVYEVFEQEPDLAIFLLQLRALEEALKKRTTLILDEQTPPFNMLTQPPAVPSAPAPEPAMTEIGLDGLKALDKKISVPRPDRDLTISSPVEAEAAEEPTKP